MTSWLLILLAAPFALALVVACLRDPMRVALPIFAALIPFGGGLSVGPSRYGSVSSLIGMLLAAGLVLQLITHRRSARRLSQSVGVWLLFLGTACATTLWTIERSTTINGLAVLGSLVLVYLFAAMSHVDRTALRRTENGLLVGGVAVVGYGFYQLLVLGGFPAEAGGGPAPDGRFGNDLLGPGVQAVSLLLPFTLALSRAFQESERIRKLAYAAIVALMFCGVLMTGSRTGTLATGLVLVTMVLSGPRQARKGILMTLAAGLVAAVLVWVYHPAGVASRTFESATSSSGRTDIWQVGLAACPDYCLYGSGWGTYPKVYAETQASVPEARVLRGDEGSYQPHNLWLLAVVELGLPGLILLTWGLALALVEAARLPIGLRAPPLSAAVGLAFSVFFLSSMEFKFFWMVLIMIALYRNVSLDEVGKPGLGSGRAVRPSAIGRTSPPVS